MSRTSGTQPEAGARARHRRLGLFAVQGVLSAVLAYLALRSLDWTALGRMAVRQSLSFFVVSWLLYLLITLLYTLRWQEVLRAMGHPKDFALLARQVFVGFFFNNFTPSMVGQDASKTYYLGRDMGYVSAGVSVLVDKILGLGALTVLGATLILLLGLQSLLFQGSLLASLFLALACAVALSFPRLHLERFIPAFISRWPLGRKIVDLATRSISQTGKAVTLRVLVVGLAVVLVSVTGMASVYSWFLVAATGSSPSIASLMAVLCLVSSVVNMPISVNGIGVREQAHALLLMALGVPLEAAMGLSLLQYVFILTQSLIGWAFWITRHRKGTVAVSTDGPI